VQPQKPPALAGSRLDLLTYLALLLATFAVYAQVCHFAFVNYDDPEYITGNLHVRQGLTAHGLAWALTSHEAYNWFPLTWVSHMLDCQFFGLESGWHHLHNVLLHALAAILLCIFLQRATGARWRSALVAFLFALHPLHVESVAWVAERKDVLSACFWFLTLWAYVWYTKRPGWGRYLALVLSLCLGLMAKPMVVTLPFVLLLVDYWPLARLRQQGRKAIWEKLPLLGLSGAAAAITYLVQEHAGTVKALPFEIRLANAVLSCTLYILKTFWPSRLAVFYPYPRSFPFLPLLAAGLLLAAVSTGVIVLRRRSPYLWMGWGWFATTLVPVIGLVQVGGQARADRYTYIPMVGLLIMLVWGTAEILERLRAKVLAVPLAAAACVACAALTCVQVGYWRDSETLFRHALEVTGDNSVADISLGRYLMASPGRLSEALPYLETAVRIDPDSATAHTDLGIALDKTGRLPDAIAQFQTAIRLDPDAPIPHSDLGSALIEAGRLPDAIAELESALRIEPNDATAQLNLGVALADTPGRLPDALRHFEEAERLSPDPKLERAIANLQAQRQ
jgi:protein O-mannosyl-transferase